MSLAIGTERTSAEVNPVEHVFYESPGRAHERQTWRRDLTDFAPRLFHESPTKP